MNINNRFCTQIGHEQAQLSHLCIYENCEQLELQCCILCINEGIHNHDKSDNNHIRLEQEIQKVQQKLPQEEKDKNIKPIDFSKRKYKVKEIEKRGPYTSAHISNNEKYLVYGNGVDFNRIIKIYDIQQDKIIKELQLNDSFYFFQFSFDSSQLYVGCQSSSFDLNWDSQYFSLIIGYDVEKNLKKIFLYKMGQGYLNSIITIQNQYFITCVGKKIIKTDFKRKKQVFKLISLDTFSQDTFGIIFNIFDYNQQYDLIIGGSEDGSIKLWDCCKKSLIIHKKQAHSDGIYSIQFIYNQQNVFILDCSNKLYKWNIDLINNNLIKIQEYPYSIYSFCSVNQNQNLLLMCSYSLNIVDDKGQIINQIDIQQGDKYYIDCSRQLDNARYILLATYSDIREKTIMLASALE